MKKKVGIIGYGWVAGANHRASYALSKDAEIVAEKVAGLIRDAVPEYLHGEWRYANRLASSPVIDAVVEALIERGLLTPPEDGVGAEGCWMAVEK